MKPRTVDSVPLPPAMWHVSPRGYELLKSWEGLKLRSYDDGAGNRSIGFGHKQNDREPSEISLGQAEALLKLDALKAVGTIRNAVTRHMWQCEVDALVSLVYNIGSTAFVTSHLLIALNKGDMEAVKHEWLRWDHEGRKEVPGLLARRRDELAMFCEVPF